MTFSNHTAGPIPEDAGNSQGSPGSGQPLRASLTGCFSPFPAGQRLRHAHQHLRPEPLPARRHLPPEREPQGRLQVTAHPRPTLPWAPASCGGRAGTEGPCAHAGPSPLWGWLPGSSCVTLHTDQEIEASEGGGCTVSKHWYRDSDAARTQGFAVAN